MISPDSVVVGRIGRAHGIKGEVSVVLSTDEPSRRFAVGTVLDARLPTGVVRTGGLTVCAVRWHHGRMLVHFAEIADRTAAEDVRNVVLEANVSLEERPEDPEEFYDRDLIGLAVETVDGRRVGTVTSVVHGTTQDLLAIDIEGREALVPFVSALVPTVDLTTGVVVVADRPGLLDGDPR